MEFTELRRFFQDIEEFFAFTATVGDRGIKSPVVRQLYVVF